MIAVELRGAATVFSNRRVPCHHGEGKLEEGEETGSKEEEKRVSGEALLLPSHNRRCMSAVIAGIVFLLCFASPVRAVEYIGVLNVIGSSSCNGMSSLKLTVDAVEANLVATVVTGE
ncbi:hypothetical protein PIB30_104033 [Stylosanthes scabra]|uniref:Uncharacterized protein n=1 Tax=Stylosanthes scabra TaxID=79078 RepID=A0ABU6WWE2_9FABA|nr:hypothetical protein [Stylosanthes scabra]